MSERRNRGSGSGFPADGEAVVVSRVSPRNELLIGLFLSAVVFAFHLVLESKLRDMGAFVFFNTLFNADPGLTLEAISSGGGGNHLSHPLLEYFFSIPIWAVAKLGALVTSGSVDESLARQSLGLVVVPVASGFLTFSILRLFRAVGLSLRSAFMLTVLGSLSFGSLVLGSIPESYTLSALCISLGYLLFVRTKDRRGLRVEIAWLTLGVATAGITVTNIVAVAILYLAREFGLGRGLWKGTLRTAAMAVVALAVTLGAGKGLDVLFDAQPGGTPNEMVWIARYFVDDPLVQYTTFPTAVINGLTPPVPERKPNRFALKAKRAAAKDAGVSGVRRQSPRPGLTRPGDDSEPRSTQEGPRGFLNQTTEEPTGAEVESGPQVPAEGAKDKASAVTERIIPFSLTLQRTHKPRSIRNYVGFILLAALAWVAVKAKHLNSTLALLARASLAVIAFNWLLHGFWGGEQFLYLQHWHVSLLVLMAAAVSVFEARRWSAVALLGVSIFGVAVSNAIVLWKMLRVLAGD